MNNNLFMNPSLQRHLISASRVFASTFLVTVAAAVTAAGTITWTKDFWLSIGVAAVSTALKTAYEAFLQ